ncbi:hypothetical protein J3P95_11100 [Pseudomonas sp. Z5-35]|uniref:hypothetical protein n=1 Tax=unclassified Pseudomonas TaxID=196821 RepID=UPI003DA9157F
MRALHWLRCCINASWASAIFISPMCVRPVRGPRLWDQWEFRRHDDGDQQADRNQQA